MSRLRRHTAWHAASVDIVIGRELDFEDLYTTPDDGNRYEILDGALVMTPAPSTDHQSVLLRLCFLLDAPAREHDMKVLPAPTAWRIAPGQVPEPDVIVATRDVVTRRAVEGPPALVVEILSRSGRPRDLYEKRRIYAEGGAAWYWIVDPDVPSLSVLRLAGSAYEEEAHVSGSDAYEAIEPFTVRVVPIDLTA